MSLPISESTPCQRLAILTISDTRTMDTDQCGKIIRELAISSEMIIEQQTIVKDDSLAIRKQVEEWLQSNRIDTIITTGGTGIAKRDVSIEAIRPLFEKELNGFGELFRFISFTEDVGTKAFLSRTAAGVANEKAIFILPGSQGAVRLAMKSLILPEITHIKHELIKHRGKAFNQHLR